MKTKARAVLISDVHFSLATLELATASLKAAVEEAQECKVPLIIAGDLNDTKAILRGEVANRLIEILSGSEVPVLILVGNHDLINEKAKAHSLNFLRPYATVIDEPTQAFGLYFIPYQASPEAFREALAGIPKGATIIAHQGFLGAAMGEYVVDKSSIDPKEVKAYRVITGHYHKRQVIGTVEYIGTPYSVTFAEANDGLKGFRVLREDGVLEFIPTGLRKHVKVERTYSEVMDPIEDLKPCDLLWLKVHGPASELDKLNKKTIGQAFLGHANFKLDKVYAETVTATGKPETLTKEQILDRLIDGSEETKAGKVYLKKLWREICE